MDNFVGGTQLNFNRTVLYTGDYSVVLLLVEDRQIDVYLYLYQFDLYQYKSKLFTMGPSNRENSHWSFPESTIERMRPAPCGQTAVFVQSEPGELASYVTSVGGATGGSSRPERKGGEIGGDF